MGCRFAPAFSVIFLHHLEQQALEKISFKPQLYKRYIDDVILGPIESNLEMIKEIEQVFNSIVPEINFTTEIQLPHKGLNFLDLTIHIKDHKIDYYWLQKRMPFRHLFEKRLICSQSHKNQLCPVPFGIHKETLFHSATF